MRFKFQKAGIHIVVVLMLGLTPISQVRGAESTCFCLRYVDGSLIRGCNRETKGPQDEYPLAACRAADGKVTLKSVASGWTHVEAGSPGCDPCPSQTGIADLPDRPRGPDEAGATEPQTPRK